MNPNGKLWSDSDNVGKKMIQKLGWAEGDGLGRNKQGTKTHIKVSLKNDRDGVGMRAGNGSQNAGLLQTFNYDMLLKSKCAEQKESRVVEPIARSMSRAKFGRAVRPDYFKPLNQKDWINILGSSSTNENGPEETKIELSKDQTELNHELERKFVTKNVNISQYFEQQLKLKRDKQQLNKMELNFTQEVESQCPKAKRMKMEVVDVPDLKTVKVINFDVVQETGDNCIDEKQKKKSKKKNKTTESLSQANVTQEEVSNESYSPKQNKSKESKDKTDKIETNSDKELKKKVRKGKQESQSIIDMIASTTSLEQKLKETDRKLMEIEEFLSNEPLETVKKPRKDKTTLTIVKEADMECANYKVEELSTIVYKSPLDTSNIRDIKGYKYY